ncbi:MAG TPA: hypothetical protein ENN03_01650 [bacterium]|nr:hypothetical protein [bacterium]
MSRGALFLIVAVVCNASANILIKVGSARLNEEQGFWKLIAQAALQPVLWAGVILFGMALGAYSLVLTRLNLSVAYPVMISTGLIIVVIVSALFLNEKITLIQLAGFFCILTGVWLVAK